MDLKASKGKWKDTLDLKNNRIVRNEGGIIATIKKPNRYTGQDERYEQEMEEYKSNAKLIAAAPELFEALKEMLDWVKQGDYESSFLEKPVKALNSALGNVL